ncbi:MAG: hypothetical protein ACP5E5_14405 [Acidobacteriaceae bacterium]
MNRGFPTAADSIQLKIRHYLEGQTCMALDLRSTLAISKPRDIRAKKASWRRNSILGDEDHSQV